MNYKALIDFNKYTLALATAGLIYTFERLPEFKQGFPIFVLLALLVLFAVSLLLAIALFAAATRALHLPQDRDGELDGAIRHLGRWHSGLLFTAIIILGFTMFVHAMTELGTETDSEPCCCVCSNQTKNE